MGLRLALLICISLLISPRAVSAQTLQDFFTTTNNSYKSSASFQGTLGLNAQVPESAIDEDREILIERASSHAQIGYDFLRLSDTGRNFRNLSIRAGVNSLSRKATAGMLLVVNW